MYDELNMLARLVHFTYLSAFFHISNWYDRKLIEAQAVNDKKLVKKLHKDYRKDIRDLNKCLKGLASDMKPPKSIKDYEIEYIG